jgi:hypothetical protein
MANGLFNLKQVMQAVQQGGWPAQKPPAVEYLVVAGGGGGQNYGGGGAGGLLTGLDPVPNGQTLLVTVGAGGTGGGSPSNGSNSVFGSFTTTGGGYPSANAASTGGSGAGSGDWTYVGAQGIAGQGNKGGNGSQGDGYSGGGGGGAGTAGINSGSGLPGRGGAGIASAISGTVTAYAGGGGGGHYQGTGTTALGGAGGGGNGGSWNPSPVSAATAGSANTGGGGGGTSSTPGAGGSGIVIVSYPDVYAAATTVNATASTSGSGSLAFTGATTNYLSYGGQTPFVFGTGDFTIEFWVYFNSVAGSSILADWRAGGSNGAFPTIYMNGANMIYYVNGTDAITSSALSTSTWYHIAACRTGTVTKMYLNGTQTGSSYTDTTNYTANATAPWLGGAGATLNGNITNFRAVKGVCVYTGTFTPSTSPLAATQPAGTNIAAITGTQTSLLLNSASGARLADSSTNSYVASVTGTVKAWSQQSPFATGSGYKNPVYTWTTTGTITF